MAEEPRIRATGEYARLLAAAPDLLAALEKCLGVLEALPNMEAAGAQKISLWPATRRVAREAIAKARGETPKGD
jgi:hypothetical protein